MLGNSRSLEQGDLQAFYNKAFALNQPDVRSFLLNEKGEQVLNTIVPFGTPAPPAVSSERVRIVKESGRPLVSELITGSVTRRKLTTVNVQAAAAGGRYVVGQAFAVEHWKRKALTEQVPSDWIVAVIDQKGRFIARSHGADKYVGEQARPELVAAAARASNGLIRHNTLENIDSYDAFTHSALTGWTIAVAAPAAAIDAASTQAMHLATAGLLVAMGLAFAVAALLGGRFIRAFEVAGDAAVLLGQGRKPARRESSIAEVDNLHRSLSDAGGLLEAERESRVAAEAEKERLLRNETAARQVAQGENEAKDKFLAMLGHELRNPLAAISGAVAVLERTGGDAERASRFLAIVRRQSTHLTHIVDDLLEVSRLMAGKIELDLTPLDLAGSLQHCVDSMRQSDKATGHIIGLDAVSAWIQGDPVRIEQIVNNLIGNALKFSPPGTQVRVTLKQREGQAHVTVTDDGNGMTADLLNLVFEPFVQGPPPANRAQSGLGIGLALVKELVALHGGDVLAESDGPGRGSRFSFWIPCIPVGASEQPVRAEIAHGRRKLVYVEDNADASEAMLQLLGMLGYDVVQVDEGRKALAAVLAAQPDAVILDIGLPDMDGYEVAQQLRANLATAHVPLIALTGYGQSRDKEKAALAGFDAHLIKPVDTEQLVRTIEAVTNLAPT